MNTALARLTSLQRRVLIIAVLSSFVAFLDGTVVNVALPAISRELGGGLQLQQWVVDAYLITLGAFILVAGSLSDLFGRRRVLFVGLIGFGVTSLVCAGSVSGIMLIIARALQGVSGALLVPSSLALIMSSFGGAEQSRAIGRWTAWTGIAALLGPVLGGLFVDTLSWRFVFVINVIPIAVTLLLLVKLPNDGHRSASRVDVLGAVLGALGLGGTVFALIEQDVYGWASLRVLVPAAIGVGALVAFFVAESRVDSPMLPITIFRVRNFWVGNIATALIYGPLALGTFIVALYLQQAAGVPAIVAGFAFIPSTLLMMTLSGLFGRLAGQHGARMFMAIGPVIAGLGFLWMLTVHIETSYWSVLLWLLPGVLFFGLGMSITVAPLTAAILGAIHSEQAGIASAVNNAISRIAGLIAVALAALIVGGSLDTDGLHRTLLVVAVLLFLGGGVSAVGIRNRARGERAARSSD
jgi:EmrB/QacA subfamily drug resistance transporter